MDRPGRILIFTGDGKGKTTAALGMALRTSGHDLRALVMQFIKDDGSTGELAALRQLPGVEIVQKGKGFLPDPLTGGSLIEAHRRGAREALELGRAALRGGRYHLVVLDEICIALAAGLIDEDAVIEMLEQADPRVCVVLTGRAAPLRLIELADTVTEMRCLKHGYQSGHPAQVGVEY